VIIMENATKVEKLTIAEIMTPDVVTTTVDRPIEEVARELRTRGFGALPVVDDKGMLIGIVSEFDIISKRGHTAGEVMTRGAITVDDTMSADQVTALMGAHGIRRVPVVRDGRLMGIISRSDLLRLYTLARWDCDVCGDYERGFLAPERCVRCGGTSFHLVNEQRTANG
jgi:CBS domain-containing protein